MITLESARQQLSNFGTPYTTNPLILEESETTPQESEENSVMSFGLRLSRVNHGGETGGH
jgi:hypothetical protein